MQHLNSTTFKDQWAALVIIAATNVNGHIDSLPPVVYSIVVLAQPAELEEKL